MTTIRPCPICGAPYGFHDDEPHLAAVARIPAHLMLATASDQREERRLERREAFAAYLRGQAEGEAEMRREEARNVA